jgi:hypothetical protein
MSQPARTTRSARFASVMIPGLLCCALLLGGCSPGTASSPGKTPTASPTTAATPTLAPIATVTPTGSPHPTGTPGSAGFSTFRSGDGSYTINFPSGWGTEPMTEQGVTAQVFGSTDQVNIFAVIPITPAIPPAGYDTIIENFAGKSGFGGTDLLIFPVSTTTTITGTTWTRITATFTLQSTPESLIGYVAPLGSGTYALVFFAPDTTFAAIDAKDFEVMAQSFTYLGTPGS